MNFVLKTLLTLFCILVFFSISALIYNDIILQDIIIITEEEI